MRNTLGAAYEAAAKLRTPTSSPNLLDIIDLLDHYSKRNPLALSELERTTLLQLFHDTPIDGLAYVEHLFDAALRGEQVLAEVANGR